MAELQNNRWVAGPDDFAVRVELADVSGFFSKTLTIEPGVRALFLERGVSVGEAAAGQYTLQSLGDKLRLWTKKTTTVVLTKQEEVALTLDFAAIPTTEFLEVELALELTVRIDDVALFLVNLMGSRERFGRDDLTAVIAPVVRQALWESIGRMSIKDLTGSEARGDLEIRIQQALRTVLARYGLQFGHVRTLSVAHPEYDEQRRRKGQLWLQRGDHEHRQEEAKQQAEKLLADIRSREQIDELEILAQQVAADRMEGELAAKLRRIAVRKHWRDSIQAEEFDKLNTEEDLKKFLEQRDHERLIREEEYESLAAAIQEKETDRQARRAHLLQRLQVEQDFELQGVRIELDHAQQMQLTRHEIALAELTDSEESRKWKANLEREAVEADRLRAEESRALEHAVGLARQKGASRRQLETDDAAHEQQLERYRGEVAVEKAERNRRVALIEQEVKKARDHEELELTRRKRELELDFAQRESTDQTERLRAVQALNADYDRQQRDLNERDLRMKAELELLREDKQADRELQRIQAMRGMSAVELMAFSPNAAVIADVEKHKATQQTQAASAADKERMYDRLNEAEKAKSDALVAAMQQMLAGQQSSFDRFGSIVENVTRNLAPQGGAPAGGGRSPTETGAAPFAGAGGRKIVLCPACRAENNETVRFCGQCGKAL